MQKTFNLALPYPAQICKCYTKVPADPGFNQRAFKALKALKANESGEKLICSLMIDEMAIQEHVTYDGKTFCGYVDLGNDAEIEDSLPLAKDALFYGWHQQNMEGSCWLLLHLWLEWGGTC